MISKLTDLFRQRANRSTVYSSPAFWDRKARSYSGSAVSMFVNRALNVRYQREQFRFIDDVIGPIDGLDVLDVGCGTGRLSRHLADRGARVSAFDFSAEAVAIAQRENGVRAITVRVQSVFDFTDEAAFDRIVVLGCLSAACRTREEFAAVVVRLYRALRPGGVIAIVEPFHHGFLRRVLPLSLPEVRTVMEDAGFTITHNAELHFWPARLVLAPVEWPAWLTNLGASAGDGAMHLLGRRLGLGDYKGLGARRG